MSSFTISGPGGNAYVVGDVLTIPAPGPGTFGAVMCTTQPTVTVATVTSPAASFTDSVGTKFQ